jgi:general secretion pathway protein D
LRYFGKVNDDIYVTIEAMASDGRLNVIQKPRVQTSHATPASIFIGSTVPYVSSTYYGGGYGGYPSSSYQQLSVGIGLNVTPFINQDGLVVMKIDETIDEISDYTKIDNNSVPNTTHRTLSAEVAVHDRETIMLGGFIRNADTKSKSGVPYLKDLPLLGSLFSSKDSTKSRKELMILMRPTVLKTPELAALHVDEEKAEMPGVRAAEAEAAKSVREMSGKSARTRSSKSPSSNKGTPFTPEEMQLYGNPSATPTPPATTTKPEP